MSLISTCMCLMHNWFLTVLNCDRLYIYSLLIAVGVITGTNLWTFWFTNIDEKFNEPNFKQKLDTLLEKKEELLICKEKLIQLEALIDDIQQSLTSS